MNDVARHLCTVSRDITVPVLLAAPPARVLAHLAQCKTHTDLAAGFAVGATAGFRYVREALDVLAARAPSPTDAIRATANKAFVTICVPPR